MDKGHMFRRIFHMSSAVLLVYYLLPERIYFMPREVLMLSFLAAVLVIEAVRIKTGTVFFGLRGYEGKQISAYAWGAAAIAICFLFFPMVFVVPSVLGMALIDPLIGEVRRNKEEWYPYVPGVCYAVMLFLCLFFLSGFGLAFLITFTAAGTATALLVEYPKLKYVDDDFLMVMGPVFVLTLMDFLIQLI